MTEDNFIKSLRKYRNFIDSFREEHTAFSRSFKRNGKIYSWNELSWEIQKFERKLFKQYDGR